MAKDCTNVLESTFALVSDWFLFLFVAGIEQYRIPLLSKRRTTCIFSVRRCSLNLYDVVRLRKQSRTLLLSVTHVKCWPLQARAILHCIYLHLSRNMGACPRDPTRAALDSDRCGCHLSARACGRCSGHAASGRVACLLVRAAHALRTSQVVRVIPPARGLPTHADVAKAVAAPCALSPECRPRE